MMPITTSDLLGRFDDLRAMQPPVLPYKNLCSFVAHHFDRREQYFKITEKQAIPLYLQETGVLASRASQMKKVFKAVLPDVAFYFAVKSNNHPDVSRTLLTNGFGLDVSSGVELEMAIGLGARDIMFSGPGKTMAELKLATLHADKVVVLIDSFGELERLENTAATLNRQVRCGVRLSVSATGPWRKFGISPDDLGLFLQEALKCRHILLSGLQFHSSWNLSPEPQVAFIKRLGNVLADIPSDISARIAFVDIGGGFWPEQGEWLQPAGTKQGQMLGALGYQTGEPDVHYYMPASRLEEFAAQLSDAIHRYLFNIVPCRICLEPGRWICNDAVQLLISVVDKKSPDMVITDAGTNTIGWERFETDYFPILNLTRPEMLEKPCLILGSLCTPHDVWGYTYWGSDIQPGDILLVPSQGAYTYSLRQNFIKPLPAVVTI